MKYKTFKYKDNENCSFCVRNYPSNKDSMQITIVDEKGDRVRICTTNSPDFIYQENTATIKNYSINTGMTNFFIRKGIVKQVITRRDFKIFASSKKESIDYCDIDIDKLKKYSSKFEYVYE